jgi:hypothetical protein
MEELTNDNLKKLIENEDDLPFKKKKSMTASLFRIKLSNCRELYIKAGNWEEAISKAEKRIYSDEIIEKLKIEEADVYYDCEIIEVTKLFGEIIY